MFRLTKIIIAVLLVGGLMFVASGPKAFAQRMMMPRPSQPATMPMRPSQPVMHIPMNPTFVAEQQALAASRHFDHHEHHGHPSWWWWNNPYWYANPYLNPYLMYGAYGYGGSYGYPSYTDQPSYAAPPSYAKPALPAPTGPSAEERQRRLEQVTLDRAVKNPEVNEIASGTALNVILADLQKIGLERGWKELPATGLDMPAEMLSRINVSHGGSGNVGILKDWRRITWPAALNGPEFKLQRKQVDELVQTAIAQAKQGRVNADVIQKLSDSVSGLQQQLRDNTVNLTFSMHTEAKTFLTGLQDAVAALQQPDVQSFMNGEFQVKAKTIPELVQWMTDNGLQFAPAVPGDEAAYTTLRGRLAAYDRALHGTPIAEQPKAGSSVTP